MAHSAASAGRRRAAHTARQHGHDDDRPGSGAVWRRAPWPAGAGRTPSNATARRPWRRASAIPCRKVM